MYFLPDLIWSGLGRSRDSVAHVVRYGPAMPVSPCVLQHVKSGSKEAGTDRKLDSIYAEKIKNI